MKKLGAYLLSAAMFLSVIFGGGVSLSVYAENQTDLGDFANAGEVKLSVGASNSTAMEIGDEVTVYFTLDMKQSLDVYKVAGKFVFDTNVFEPLEIGDIQPTEDLDLYTGYDENAGILSFGTTKLENGDNGISVPVEIPTGSTVLGKATLKVKKATDSTKFSYTGIEIETEAGRYNGGDVNISVDNTEKDKRIFEFGIKGETTVNNQPVFTVNKESTLIVPLTIEQNTGFCAVQMTVTYGNGLEYQSIEPSGAMKAYITLKDIHEENGKLTFSYMANKDIKLVNKDLLYLKFKAKQGSGSDTIKVTVTKLVNQSDVAMKGTEDSIASKTCTVNYEPKLQLGDVNGDNEIDLVDATYVLQYYNGIRTLTDEQKVRADVSGSDSVTLIDALQIMRFYNGAISSF